MFPQTRSQKNLRMPSECVEHYTLYYSLLFPYLVRRIVLCSAKTTHDCYRVAGNSGTATADNDHGQRSKQANKKQNIGDGAIHLVSKGQDKAIQILRNCLNPCLVPISWLLSVHSHAISSDVGVMHLPLGCLSYLRSKMVRASCMVL